MKPTPKLPNDFIVNESEYQACKAWLYQANEETIRHPLDDPELEMHRQSIKALVDEYEKNGGTPQSSLRKHMPSLTVGECNVRHRSDH